MKLKSGKTVTLTPLNTAQKIECFDIEGPMESAFKWAMYGLGFKSLAAFDEPENKYTIKERAEIAEATLEATEKGADPTTKG